MFRFAIDWPRLGRELHDKGQAAGEGFIQVAAQVRGEDRDVLVLFHLLKKIAYLNVSEAVVRASHLRALAEKRQVPTVAIADAWLLLIVYIPFYGMPFHVHAERS